MMKHLKTNKILTNLNHGFRSGYSCETQLITTLNDLLTEHTYLLTGVRNYTTTPVSTMKDVVRLRSSTSPYSFCWRVVS